MLVRVGVGRAKKKVKMSKIKGGASLIVEWRLKVFDHTILEDQAEF